MLAQYEPPVGNENMSNEPLPQALEKDYADDFTPDDELDPPQYLERFSHSFGPYLVTKILKECPYFTAMHIIL